MRLLLVTTRYPLPPWRGQQVRTVEWLSALREDELCLVCPEPVDRTAADASRLAGIDLRCYRSGSGSLVWAGVRGGIGGLPIQESIYRTTAAADAFRTAVREHRPDAIIVQMVRCGWALDILGALAPEIPVLFDAIDAMGMHFARAVRDFAPWLRPFARVEASRCRRREIELTERADVAVAVTARDLAAIGGTEERGLVIPVAGRTPQLARSPAEHQTILLTGNLGYRPTVAAVLWFANNVWPQVQRRFPDCRWVLAGARPVRVVRELAAQPGIEIYSDVPDLDPFLADSWLALAPMSSGSGVPMKVLEAWAAGVPVVAHPWTAAGVENDALGALRQAENPADWVDTISELFENEEARNDLATRGRKAWNRFYHPDRVAEMVRRAVTDLVAR